jgi:hypothetical protein
MCTMALPNVRPLMVRAGDERVHATEYDASYENSVNVDTLVRQ